jgi:hypothetical protein
MNRRTFFGAVVGGTVSSRIATGSVRNTRTTPNRFTQETKLGDYFFFWTGWKKSINVPVNVAQWIAEPVEGLNENFSRDYYDRERPAFYTATTGTQGALVNLNYVMDLSYQDGFPLITDKTSTEDKQEARREALERLRNYIEWWEVPEKQYVVASNSHMIHRENLKPGNLVPVDYHLPPLSETLGRVLKKDGFTARAFKKVVKNV